MKKRIYYIICSLLVTSITMGCSIVLPRKDISTGKYVKEQQEVITDVKDQFDESMESIPEVIEEANVVPYAVKKELYDAFLGISGEYMAATFDFESHAEWNAFENVEKGAVFTIIELQQLIFDYYSDSYNVNWNPSYAIINDNTDDAILVIKFPWDDEWAPNENCVYAVLNVRGDSLLITGGLDLCIGDYSYSYLGKTGFLVNNDQLSGMSSTAHVQQDGYLVTRQGDIEHLYSEEIFSGDRVSEIEKIGPIFTDSYQEYAAVNQYYPWVGVSTVDFLDTKYHIFYPAYDGRSYLDNQFIIACKEQGIELLPRADLEKKVEDYAALNYGCEFVINEMEQEEVEWIHLDIE